MKLYKKYLNLLLTVLLLVSGTGVFNVAFAEDDEPQSGVTWEIIDNDEEFIDSLRNVDDGGESLVYAKRGNKRVSIILEGKSAMETYPDLDPDDDRIQSYRDILKQKQDKITERISEEILGGELNVAWNLTLATNMISAYVPDWAIESIKQLDGVKDVVLENQYEVDDYDEDTAEPNMSNATKMVNAPLVWSNGYTGAGSIIAVIDTGLDLKHISFSSEGFDHAIQEVRESGKEVDLLTKQEICDNWTKTNAFKKSETTYEQAYVNSKVPFAYNYVDNSFDVSHENDVQSNHGSHVASTVAANRYIYIDGEYKNALESVMVQGEAPDAQILVMKVFGINGGAYESDYFAAIEDAMVLGADAVNLSLGSAFAGFSYSEETNLQKIIDNASNTNVVWAMASGNSGYWAEHSYLGILYKDGVNYSTLGYPASYSSSLAVASVDNDGLTLPILKFNDRIINYQDGDGKCYPLSTLNGEYEFVYIDNYGNEEDYAKVKDVLEGKIAICNRGDNTFAEKATNAIDNGAVATIIVNRVQGLMFMGLTEYKYTQPVAMISLNDGKYIKEHSTFNGSYYTGKIRISSTDMISEYYGSDYYTMSDFSSYGVPGDLTLKPEITAPGGNIYGAYGTSQGELNSGIDRYGSMSGTSMATPQVAGIVALMSQYIRENNLNDAATKLNITRRALIQSLLMSTAKPLIEESTKSYFSVFRQGAGLVDVNAATGANTVILMDNVKTNGEITRDISEYARDGKVKAELGDDPGRTGKYSVSFTINNITNEDLYYDLDASFFTQGIIEGWFLDNSTVALHPQYKWTVDGVPYSINKKLDMNNDNLLNDQDAQVILDYVVGNISEFPGMENADLDGDGKITSHDAQVLLTRSNEGAVLVPADGSVSVTLDIDLGDEIKNYDFNGAYVEGYIFAKERDSEEGAIGVTHSIPVLGYYGGWDESSMVDYGSYIEDSYDIPHNIPYLYEIDNPRQSFLYTNRNNSNVYYFGGNPFGAKYDYEYRPERNSVAGNYYFSKVKFSLIRNARAGRVALYNNNGVIYEYISNEKTASFFNLNDENWYNTITNYYLGEYSELTEGNRYNISLQLALESQADKTGNINWNSVRKVWDVPFVVDSVYPTVQEIKDKTVEGETILTIKASDNNYIAVMLLYEEDRTTKIAEFGSTTEVKTGGDSETYEVNLGTNGPKHLYLIVGDYSGNCRTVKININKEEIHQAPAVAMSDTYVKKVLGNTISLSADITPYGLNNTLVWRSADESIATVDQNGTVTGVSAGRTTIYAKSEVYSTENKAVEGSCEVEFFTVNKTLNALISDQKLMLASFNTSSMPAYTGIEDIELPLSSAAYAADENLYFMSTSTDKGSTLYVKTTEGISKVNDLAINNVKDICAVPYFAESELIAVDNGNIYFINGVNGTVDGSVKPDITNKLVAVAYKCTDNTGDHVFLLDNKGIVYEAVLSRTDNTYSCTVQQIMDTEQETDETGSHSLYYDGSNLFWSYSPSTGNSTYVLYFENINLETRAYYLIGSFNEKVKVSGLYSADQLNLFPRQEQPSSENGIMSAAVTRTKIATEISTESNNTVTVNFYNNEDVKLTNGKYEIQYDSSKLEFSGVNSSARCNAVNDKNSGKIVFAFAERTGEESGAKIYSVSFTRKSDSASDLFIYEKESGNRTSLNNRYEYSIPKKGQGSQDINPNPVNNSTGYRIPITGID